MTEPGDMVSGAFLGACEPTNQSRLGIWGGGFKDTGA